VFGLLAFNALPDRLPADTILITTILCVVGSVGAARHRVLARDRATGEAPDRAEAGRTIGLIEAAAAVSG
jgi:hypothetical protein